jgi:two-component system chemotaxis response regulator CheB
MKTHQLIEATCPDCRGPLSMTDQDGLREYHCLVGHAYSAVGLLQAHSEAQEKAVWSAVVALEEATKLVEAVASDLPAAVIERLEKQAAQKRQQASEIRGILERLEPFGVE